MGIRSYQRLEESGWLHDYQTLEEQRDELVDALNELMQHIGGFRSSDLNLPMTWDESVRKARAALLKASPDNKGSL